MSHVLIGLGKDESAQQFEQRFFELQKTGQIAQWEIDTFNAGKDAIHMLVSSEDTTN
jgi:hypothetical protein